ncbi:alpha/beta fold hydrolase [Streptomyces sp. TR06-5]|uniref:alpha/beta fold hydrolase n=1 Tax=unclassified Streptomyces TaxID=2593676 RepID=UPI0039A340A9
MADAAGQAAGRPAGWARRAGIAGVALGVVAAGFAAERLTVNRAVRRRARLALDAAGPFGALRGTPGTAVADDGTALYFEVDEPSDPDRREEAAGRPTVVFSHGYCLNQDAWHFQRAALRAAGTHRCVYWDQRSHGRSGRATPGEPVSIDRLGEDLRAVLDAAVPQGPVVLVGHSMGGMAVMALAEHHPRFVAERVAGVALLSTSAGRLGEITYGFPAAGVRAARRLAPGVLRAMAAQSGLVEQGRQAASDTFATLVRRYSFGTARDADPTVARFVQRMIEAVPIDVVAEFYPAFGDHEKTAALAAFAGVPALVLTGDEDQVIPPGHSEGIAAVLPDAEQVLVEGAGHLVPLDRPETVDAHLAALLARTIRTHGSTAAQRTSAARAAGRARRPRGDR